MNGVIESFGFFGILIIANALIVSISTIVIFTVFEISLNRSKKGEKSIY